MDDLGPEDRELLELATAARSPTADDRDRVKQRLIAAGVLVGAAGATTGAAQASGALSTAKVVSLLALVGVASGAIVWVLPDSPEAGSEASERVSERQEATAPPPIEATASLELDDEATELPNDVPANEASANEASANAPTNDAPTNDAPTNDALARRAAPRPTPPRGGSLGEDVALLHRAQAERARDPAQALALAEEHQGRFPRSPLTQERTALRILLLCDLGRRAAAIRLGDRFLARTQDSPLRRSVEESCVRR